MKQEGNISLLEIEEILKKNKNSLRERFKVKDLGIFGSYVRGEQKKRSDIDILVELNEVIDLFDYVELEEFLKKLIGIKVDLVSKKALREELRDRILKEVVYI